MNKNCLFGKKKNLAVFKLVVPNHPLPFPLVEGLSGGHTRSSWLGGGGEGEGEAHSPHKQADSEYFRLQAHAWSLPQALNSA